MSYFSRYYSAPQIHSILRAEIESGEIDCEDLRRLIRDDHSVAGSTLISRAAPLGCQGVVESALRSDDEAAS